MISIYVLKFLVFPDADFCVAEEDKKREFSARLRDKKTG
jgi:hypothetical protein